jgi:hypothetical protein
MTELHRVLAEATDHVGSPDLAERALRGAGRRRARRTTLGALALVVLVGGGVAWAVQERVPHADVVDTPVPTPTPKAGPDDPSDLPSVPPIDVGVVQPLWDPAEAGGLPWTDLGLPESLQPPVEAYDPPIESPPLVSIRAARAVVARDDRFYVLDTDGARGWFSLEAPDEPMGPANDDLALSRDGTIISFAGMDGLWSRDVRSTRWRRADYPDGFLAGSEYGVSIEAQVAEMAYLADAENRWQIDVQTGRADRIVVPDFVHDVELTPRGVVLGLGSPDRGPHDGRTLVEMIGGGASPVVTRADALQSLTGLAADEDSLAATRAVSTSPADAPDDTWRNGMIALDRDDWSTRAYLPIRDPRWAYTDAGLLAVIAWLDADTVLARVVSTDGGYDTGELTLFTWNVGTGELRRVTTLPAAQRFDVALDLLGSLGSIGGVVQ